VPRKGNKKHRPFEETSDPWGLVSLMRLYIEWRAARNYSATAAANVEGTLSELILWCQERAVTRASEVTRPMLEAYQRALFHKRRDDGRPLSFRTQAWKITHIRGWFRWLARNNYIPANPAADLVLPRMPHRLPHDHFSIDEAEKVLGVPDVGTPFGLRDRAILETFYSTAIRRRELAGLKLQDVEFTRGTVFVRQGKGQKDRIVPIGDRALGWIQRYLDDARPTITGPDDESFLFLSYKGTPLHPDVLTTFVRRTIEAAGIKKPGACHLFRHTAATAMLENGADIRFIQEMLGHALISTTQIYTQVSISKLKAVHAATHPAGKAAIRAAAEEIEEPGPEQEEGIAEAVPDSPKGV